MALVTPQHRNQLITGIISAIVGFIGGVGLDARGWINDYVMMRSAHFQESTRILDDRVKELETIRQETQGLPDRMTSEILAKDIGGTQLGQMVQAWLNKANKLSEPPSSIVVARDKVGAFVNTFTNKVASVSDKPAGTVTQEYLGRYQELNRAVRDFELVIMMRQKHLRAEWANDFLPRRRARVVRQEVMHDLEAFRNQISNGEVRAAADAEYPIWSEATPSLTSTM